MYTVFTKTKSLCSALVHERESEVRFIVVWPGVAAAGALYPLKPLGLHLTQSVA